MKKLFSSAMTCAVLATLAFAGNAHAYYPTGVDAGDGGAGSDGGNVCGSGGKQQCGTKTVSRCLEWKWVSFSATAGPGSAGGGMTYVCATTETNTYFLYWNG